MHAFKSYCLFFVFFSPKHHLFFHSHQAGHLKMGRYIFLCDFMESCLANVFKLCQIVDLSVSQLSTFFLFHVDHSGYRAPCRLVCIRPLDGFICVYFQVSPPLLLRKPKQTCPFQEGIQPGCLLTNPCSPVMWNVFSVRSQT